MWGNNSGREIVSQAYCLRLFLLSKDKISAPAEERRLKDVAIEMILINFLLRRKKGLE